MNFNQFCNICDINSVFEEDKLKKFLNLANEEDILKKYKEILNEWSEKKSFLISKVEQIANLNKNTDFAWEFVLDKIEKKIEKANKSSENNEKISLILILLILDRETDSILNTN